MSTVRDLPTVREIRALYREGKTTPPQVVEGYLSRIRALEPRLHALTWIGEERVREQALALQKRGAAEGLPLWGIPILVKDNICVEQVPTTCGSRILEGFRPPYNATVIEKIRAAGGILLGMANMDEFAFGSSCEYSCYGPTRNPWDAGRVPGGSSGGSATAVAAGMTPLALGSDTGGSIRQPAAFCGVVGLKPTYGRVSRYGLVAFASSLDQIGPIARRVEDAAALLQVIAGWDPNDSTSAEVEVPVYSQALLTPVRGLRLGIPKEYFGEGMDPAVRQALEGAMDQFRRMGLSVREVSLPHTEYAVATYYIVATAEASSNLARFDGVRFGARRGFKTLLEMFTRTRGEGFGAEAKRRIMLGTFVLSSGYYEAYYGLAMRVRTLIKRDFDRAFESVDCLLTPTTPTPPFRLGEKLEDPLTMYLSDILTISANLAGVPALSLPCGWTPSGLPIGMQLIARPFEEGLLLAVAHAYETSAKWYERVPPLVEQTSN